MVKTTRYTAVYERRKLGSLARCPVSSQQHTHLIRREESFESREEFIRWVRKNGDHTSNYLFVIIDVTLDEKYDTFNGTVSIEIENPKYYAMIHRRNEGWGQNHYAEHNFLPPFDYQEFVPHGYPNRVVKLGGQIIEDTSASTF